MSDERDDRVASVLGRDAELDEIKARAVEPLTVTVGTLHLEPGDVLVVIGPADMSAKEIDVIRHQVEQFASVLGARVMVLPNTLALAKLTAGP